jgi:adenylate kinase
VTSDLTTNARSGSQAAAPRFVLLGPPASGKGTQGRRLAEYLGIDYLSTGALLRREVAAESVLGQQAKVFLDQGNYLPDELMETILAGWLADHSGGWVLDGYPRTLPQAQWLDERLAATGGLTAAIGLEAPRELLERRVADRLECQSCRWTSSRSAMGEVRVCPRCGGVLASREDDGVRNFRSRHDSYEKLTVPAIRHYLEHGKLLQIDGGGPPEEVFQLMVQRLHLP